MATLAAAIRRRRWRWSRNLLIVAALLFVLAILTGQRVGSVLTALTPPVLPPSRVVADAEWRGDQNWSEAQAEQFHFESQGTHTLPVPLSWLMALEQPLGSPLEVPFLSAGRFATRDYLLRFGFIADKDSGFNPSKLPIGFATTPYQTIPGLAHKDTAIGLTCAACHTGQLIYQGKRYVVEGGPATTDLYRLTLALRAALGQTAVSAKLPFLNGRFRRFAKAVLGTEYDDIASGQLAADLDSIIKVLQAQPSGMDVTEGFSRLDALNRIGNQVFAIDPGRFENYVNPNAPVKYPHIWTTPWFNWVQYDGSIMRPMVRNAGEALGVSAGLDFAAPPGHGRFSSTIPFDDLDWIEGQLRGEPEPIAAGRFNGLNGPRWPRDFPKIDQAVAARGERLYGELCSGCHLPALTPAVADGHKPDDPFWTHFGRISWFDGGEVKRTAESVLNLHVIRHDEIGTDPAQGMVLVARQVNTAGTELDRAGSFSPGLGLKSDVCALVADPKKAAELAAAEKVAAAQAIATKAAELTAAHGTVAALAAAERDAERAVAEKAAALAAAERAPDLAAVERGAAELAAAEKEAASLAAAVKAAEVAVAERAAELAAAERAVELAAVGRAADRAPGDGPYGTGSPKADVLTTEHVSDGATRPYSLALAGAVQMAIDEWSGAPKGDRTGREPPGLDRPNCVSAGQGYKARPLNGVWAVAPFLHNGSVPTLYDLLSPVAERPKAFLLGDPSFDPVKVGLVTRKADPRGDDPKGDGYDGQGYFILDTSKPGNLNAGHEFADEKIGQGVIGRALSVDERFAIIEFLKTL